ncbi:MAG: Holliday junction branch migration protein RuvA [Acidimicrobiales bacterium]
MIGSIRGQLLDRFSNEVLVEVAGVGYRLFLSAGSVSRLPGVGNELFLHVHHHIREDSQTLYGFLSKEERVAFEALIGAHGVGPKLGLDILSVHSPVELRSVLASDDVDALCLVPGVGKKTATRLLVELKSKLDLPDVVDLTALNSDGPTEEGSRLSDVRDALTGLGYSPEEIRSALASLDSSGDRDSADLLKAALNRLALPR